MCAEVQGFFVKFVKNLTNYPIVAQHTQAIKPGLVVCQTHQLVTENARIHQFDGAIRLVGDLGLEFHLVKDLGLQVNARSDLNQGYAFRTQLETRRAR